MAIVRDADLFALLEAEARNLLAMRFQQPLVANEVLLRAEQLIVTGAQGFVGRYLIAHLLSSDPGAEVIGIGRSPRTDTTFTHRVRCGTEYVPAWLPDALRHHDHYRYFSVDIRNTSEVVAILKFFQPEFLFHLASGLRDDAVTTLFETNVHGTLHFLEAVAESTITPKKIVLGSTGGVYGRPKSLPLAEDATCDPIDMYAVSKLAAEQASRIVGGQYQLPMAWARLFNLVGPGQDERHICGDLSARVSAIVAGVVPAVLEVGRLDIRHRKFRSADIERHFADVKRLRSLGFSPRYSLQHSIDDVLEYYKCLAANDTNDSIRVIRG